MKIVQQEFLFGRELAESDARIKQCLREIRAAVKTVVWPAGAKKFTIHPTIEGNGVMPIKLGFMLKLAAQGWKLEQRPVLAKGVGPGKVDALKTFRDGRQFAAEWETGNISSSHRALNKMAMGILEGHLIAGVLVLPERDLYKYLTQRIGNYRELAPYFPLYRRLQIGGGMLAVLSVAHDATSKQVALIPKGMDGNSLLRRLLAAKAAPPATSEP